MTSSEGDSAFANGVIASEVEEDDVDDNDDDNDDEVGDNLPLEHVVFTDNSVFFLHGPPTVR